MNRAIGGNGRWRTGARRPVSGRASRPAAPAPWGILCALSMILLPLCSPLGAMEAAPAEGSQPAGEPDPAETHLLIRTTLGTLRVKLHAAQAPLHCAAFLRWSRAGIYDGTLFNEIRRHEWVEAGHYQTRVRKLPPEAQALLKSIPAETGTGILRKGTLILRAPASETEPPNTSFVIWLQGGERKGGRLTAFGEVVDGLELLDRLGNLRVNSRGNPVGPLAILNIEAVPSSHIEKVDPALEQLHEERYVQLADPRHLQVRPEPAPQAPPPKDPLAGWRRALFLTAGLLVLFGVAVTLFAKRIPPRQFSALGGCALGLGLFILFAAWENSGAPQGEYAPLLYLGVFAAFWVFQHCESGEAEGERGEP